jgi:hypothetical protein
MILHYFETSGTEISKLLQPLVAMPQLQQLFMVHIHAWLTWDKLAEAEAQHILFKGRGV